jgi:hypothetical protein
MTPIDEAIRDLFKEALLSGWTIASIVPVSIRIAGEPVAYRATIVRRDEDDQPEIVVYGAGGTIGIALASAARKAMRLGQ